MTNTNSERRVRDALDDIDEAVARITDDDIEDRLEETLRRARQLPHQASACTDRFAEEDPIQLFL